MLLKIFDTPLSVCKIDNPNAIDLTHELTFVGVTDEELSLVCPTAAVPPKTIAREDGWRALRIEGILDFSLIGIIAQIGSALGEAGIGIFVVSTFNTDYVLVKETQLQRSIEALSEAGFELKR